MKKIFLILTFSLNLFFATNCKPGEVSNPADPGSSLYYITNLINLLLQSGGTQIQYTIFWGNDGTSDGVYRTDGSTEGTFLLQSGVYPVYLGKYSNSVTIREKIYFQGCVVSSGDCELWVTDGTPEGTYMLKDIYPGSFSSNPDFFTSLNDKVYFRAFDGSNNELWVTDGTSEGTIKITNANINPIEMVSLHGNLYFNGTDASLGTELWKSDGTAAGTVLLTDICPGTPGSFPTGLTVMNDLLFFNGFDCGQSYELMKSDGTAAVPQILTSTSASPFSLTVMNQNLYFDGFNGTNNELMKSDGTSAGTISITSNGIAPYAMAVVNNTLYFNGTDATGNSELWASAGTTASLLVDLFPGNDPQLVPNSSSPDQLRSLNGVLIFAAKNAEEGYELWMYNPYLPVISGENPRILKTINPGVSDGYILYPVG